MGSIRVVISVLAAIAGFVVIGASAEAQTDNDDGGQYVPSGPVFGDLIVDGAATFGGDVAIVGEGFGPGAVVQLDIRENVNGTVVSTTEHAADDAGSARIEVLLEDPIGPGRYTATLSGQSPDGATVELSGGLIVEAETQQESEADLADGHGQLGDGERNAGSLDDGDISLAAMEDGGGISLALVGAVAIVVLALGAVVAFVVTRRRVRV